MQANDISLARSRLLGSSDQENNIFLEDDWHTEEYHYSCFEDDKSSDSSWRLREKMRTVSVALVVCLNIGIDPPDIAKPNPCAKKECWYDPTGQKQKGLEYIGNTLQQQYEKWQSKAKYKLCLDPTSDDLRKVCISLRKASRSDRILYHYNGHGVPKPTKNGELWVFGKHYTHYTPVAICELRSWLGDPAIYVLDCSAAGLLIPHLVDNMNMKDSDFVLDSPSSSMKFPSQTNLNSQLSFISQSASDAGAVVLAACRGNEQLPFHPMYPVDIFTSCLTTPTTIAIRWFILQNPYSMRDVNPDIAETIPGKDNDRKTPRGELNWILTAITDTIAWNTLPAKLFQKMFRKDLLVASLFRNFLLAKRIMKSFGCTPQSWPPMPDSTTHALWQSWDMALESFLTHYVSMQNGSSMLVDSKHNLSLSMPSNLSFFNDQLSAFELWLEFGNLNASPPAQLPVLLQVLLSQSHRMRALQLLKKFLSLGSEAIKLSLILGIFPYILKLLQNPAEDIKQILISIWASVISFDSSCRQELVREKSQSCFIQGLTSKTIPSSQRCLAAFVLAEVCNKYPDGQQSCLLLGLHRSCTSILSQPEVVNSGTFKLWICLCLYKLCEDFPWAKYLVMTEAGHTHLYPLLLDPDPSVRTAAVLALGELFGASQLKNANTNTSGKVGTPGNNRPSRLSISSSTSEEDNGRHFGSNSLVDDGIDLSEIELQLALQILDCCTDGSVMVRLECVYALSKFFIQPAHLDSIKLVAKAIYIRNYEKRAGATTAGGKTTAERRSTSPGAEAANANRLGTVYPWHLTPAESQEIMEQVESFIRSQGYEHSSSPTRPKQPDTSSVLFDNYSKNKGAEETEVTNNIERDQQSPTPALATLMASAYIRLWLALIEVQGKDPHAMVAQAAATIRFRIHALIAMDERNELQYKSTDALQMNKGRSNSSNSLVVNEPVGYQLWGASQSPSVNNTAAMGLMEQRYNSSSTLIPPHSPGGNVAFGSPGTSQKTKSIKFGSKLPPPSPFLMQPDNQYPHNVSMYSSSLDTPGNLPYSRNNSYQNYCISDIDRPPSNPNQPPVTTSSVSNNHKNYFMDHFKEFAHLGEEDLLVCFASSHYDISKRFYISTNNNVTANNNNNNGMMTNNIATSNLSSMQINSSAFHDPLSNESYMRLYRQQKLHDIVQHEKYLHELFRDVEDHIGGFHSTTGLSESLTNSGSFLAASKSLGKLEELSGARDTKTIGAAVGKEGLSHSNCKFEQRCTLHIDNPTMTTSTVMFHGFHDILVVATGSTASIWSLATHNKIVDIKNRHTLKSNEGAGGYGGTSPTRSKVQAWGNNGLENNSPFSPNVSNARITSMTWINESYDSLLLLGSDDGVVKVWRDISSSEAVAPTTVSNANVMNGNSTHGSPALQCANSQVELATAFSALPDIAETSRGSGIVVSWQQTAGTLVVGGNSSTMRVWDLGREQNVRVFQTGVETCLTAMSTHSVSSQFSSSFNHHDPFHSPLIGGMSTASYGGGDNAPVTWTFAGFADGSIGVYDERVHSNGGRVHFSHTNTSWVNFTHLRADVPEVIIGSVRGTVKFWDLRTMRTYKTLEVQKSALTAIAVHNCAPIMATGSHAQFIKILTLGGEQLGNIIKYYDGFLGQRIGAVSSLAFHPHRLLLAASSVDGIVSIYSAGGEKPFA